MRIQRKDFATVKEEHHDISEIASSNSRVTTHDEVICIDSSEEENDSNDADDRFNEEHDYASKQLVIYDPSSKSTDEIVPMPNPISYEHSPFPIYASPESSFRVLPSIGTFTVQCARCFKWRLIPTKEKYEEIREHILQRPFFCESAHAWSPGVSCDDPPDISQDGSRLWAIDKPNIAQPPPGWERLLRIRSKGSTRFADVYYVTPSGKKLRSMTEVQRFLVEHPECVGRGATLSRFSFQTPKPLKEDYVRKRTCRPSTSYDTEVAHSTTVASRNAADNLLEWRDVDELTTDLRLGHGGGGGEMGGPLVKIQAISDALYRQILGHMSVNGGL